MAAAAAMARGVVPSARRQSCWTGTPEVYFGKDIDNSRVVKVDDPQRVREMRTFSIALSVLCACTVVRLATLSLYRIWLQDLRTQVPARQPGGNESGATSGRSIVARPRAHRRARPQDGHGLATARAGHSNGYGDAGW